MTASETDLSSSLEQPGKHKDRSAADRAARAVPAEGAPASGGPGLGRRLKIRSMVTMAGEVLPFFWPMRNFIHHNPLHGLEHLRFEQAVAEATRLFHARGYLRRPEYQRLLAHGSIDPAVLEGMVAGFVQDWLSKQGGQDDTALAELLERCLVALLTKMDQPTQGIDIPPADEVLNAMKRHQVERERETSEP
jgi:uncharacterized protein YbcC (UPF0753/DUF2309 family)